MSFNTKDKSQRLTFRLTEKQFNFLDDLAKQYNCSVSDILRMFVNINMYGVKK